ncbi:unnamed protein product [Cuscuta campestris]|uniref:Uncharacterized protein n=1 Tax=Cuscuta campestris TaxID=132261 RepID=A0A484L638_9ASTE|nr:unnamed protein product [Cuscuta campestris]
MNSMVVSYIFGDPLADQGASINPQDVPGSSNARVLDPYQDIKPPQGHHSSSLALVSGPKSGSDHFPNPLAAARQSCSKFCLSSCPCCGRNVAGNHKLRRKIFLSIHPSTLFL